MVYLVHLNCICIDKINIKESESIPSQQLSASFVLHSISIGQVTNAPDILHTPKPSSFNVWLTNVILRSSCIQ